MHLEMTNKICALCKRLVATNGHPDSTRLCEECRSLIQVILPKTGHGSLVVVEQAHAFAQPQLAAMGLAHSAAPVSFEEDADDVEMVAQPGHYELASFDPVADFDEVQAGRVSDVEIDYIDEFEASDDGVDIPAGALPDPIYEAMDQADEPAAQEPDVFIMPDRPESFDDRATAFEHGSYDERRELDLSPYDEAEQTISLPHARETNAEAGLEAETLNNTEATGDERAIGYTEDASYREAVDPWDDPLPAWEHSRNEYPLYVGITERKRRLRLKTLLAPAALLVFAVAAYLIFQSRDNAPQNREAAVDSGQARLESSLPVATPQASDSAKPAGDDAQPAASTSSQAADAAASDEKKDAPTASATANDDAETEWRHSLQALASQSADEANAFAERLKGAGIPAYVISADLANRGKWFRVRVGGFATAQEALKFAAESRLRAKAAGVALKDLNLVDYVKP